ncbi:MAG TPA: hypothetical protein VFQ53_38730 [Kofleriaceae bacterium]|nr:hypothetical protein [Kofleriaceae bacterium]
MFRLLLTGGLAGAALFGSVADVSAQPNVRDHRDRRPAYSGDPREAPPPVRVERVAPRRGFVWVTGNWDWRDGRWQWVSGHWERERKGRRWRDARWEKRGDVYVRIDGDWIDVDLRPTQAPPALREERFANRAGFVWVRGHWDWQDGNWVWVAGHYERERKGKRWRDVRWELRDGAWVRIDGSWDDDVVSQYPNQAPPTPREERIAARAGYVWDPGHWDWRNGQWQWTDGHWERERADARWVPGKWEIRNSRWEWTPGRWDTVALYPTAAPPPPRDERFDPRPNFVWIPGRWAWKNGQWDWTDGHWERERAGQRWVRGRWENRGNRWEWIEGSWGAAPAYPPLDEPPPAALAENPRPLPGKIWNPGNWRWENGGWRWFGGAYTDARPGYRFVPGKWIQGNGIWKWQKAEWIADAPPPPPPPSYSSGPTTPPPPPRDERYEPKSGFVWARGHYEWRNGQYEWMPGHWERERASKHWVDARWELRGNVWVFIQGGWQ